MDGTRLGSKTSRSLRAIIVSILLVVPVSIGRAGNSTRQADAPEIPTYPQSDDGFQAQFSAIAQAHCSGTTATSQRLLEQLRLQDSAAWFAQNFEPGEAAKLAERYDRLSRDYLGSLDKTMESVCKTEGAEFVVNHRDAPAESTGNRSAYRLSGVRPLREFSLARFSFAIDLKGKDTGSWEESFVYEKGAFHFIGLGAWPFWNWGEGAGPGVFKNGHFVQPGVLIYQIPPQYPMEAKAKHIEGTVVLRAIIDKEGKVKKLEVVQGDPLLVDAAKEAVKQWRYKPSTMGGNPIEIDTNITVNFQLSKH